MMKIIYPDGWTRVSMARIIGGRYRLRKKLGDGGFGEVWLADDLWLQREVAAKCVFVRDGTAHKRTFREARIAARLHHPHIVEVYDIIIEGDVPWLIMEYVHEGRDLAKLGKPLPAARVAALGVQIADALAATHAARIIHGDVKPHNVLLTRDDQVRLTDFGLSRGVRPGLSLSGSGLVHGTPAYMAPEVANGERPTPASDVFSLGATVFAAATGTSPYGEADSDVAMLRRAQDYRLLPCERAGDLADAIRPMLAKDPADRPDAVAARQALHDAAVRLLPPGGDELGQIGPGSWRGRPATPRYRRRVPLLSTAGVFFSVAAVVTWLLLWPPWEGHPSSAAVAGAPPVGDPRTVDPCAMADPAALNGFGRTQLSNDYGNFDRCDILIPSANIDVELQFLMPGMAPSAAPNDIATDGNIRVVRTPEADGECDRYLLLPDRYVVDVSANFQGDGNGPANLCSMADAAVTPAVAELRKGTLPRRSLPASSLARLNTCDLLDTRALSRALGGTVGGHQEGFGGWTCRWSSSGDLSVMLRYDQTDPLSSQDGTPVRLDGREAYVTPGGDGGNDCLVRVINRSFTDNNGQPTEEVVYLVVDGHEPQATLCSPAKALAADTVPRLPHG